MSEQEKPLDTPNEVTSKTKTKRDIFRFNGQTPTAINLDHVTNITLAEKKITFNFYTTSIFVELNDETTASSVFDTVLNIWGGHVVE